MAKSFFLYIHDALCGTPNVHKIGKTMTPYSAVRSRQKFMAKTFSLSHLYIGVPEDIDKLEAEIKYCCTKIGLNVAGAARTELFTIKIDALLKIIDALISRSNLKVKKVILEKPYSASNSSKCPLKIPSENLSYDHLKLVVQREFNLPLPTPSPVFAPVKTDFYSILFS